MNLSKFTTLLLITSSSTAAFGLGIGGGGSGGGGGGAGGSFASQTPNGVFLSSYIQSGYVRSGMDAFSGGLSAMQDFDLVPTDMTPGTSVSAQFNKVDHPGFSPQAKDYLDTTSGIQYDVGGAGTDSFVISFSGHASAEFATNAFGDPVDGHQFASASMWIGGGIPGTDWSFSLPNVSTYSGPGTITAKLRTYDGGPVPVYTDVTTGGLYMLSPLNSYEYSVMFGLHTPNGTDPDFNVSFSGSVSTAQPSVPDAGASTGLLLGIVLAGKALYRQRTRR